MISHPPFPYERDSFNVRRETRGVFRVLHDKGLELDCTYNRPELQAMNVCNERPLRWLWQDKIPLGKLTLIEGPPAVGKLFVALDIAARVSTGAMGAEEEETGRQGEGETGRIIARSPTQPAPAEDGPPFQRPTEVAGGGCWVAGNPAEADSTVQPPPSDSPLHNANDIRAATVRERFSCDVLPDHPAPLRSRLEPQRAAGAPAEEGTDFAPGWPGLERSEAPAGEGTCRRPNQSSLCGKSPGADETGISSDVDRAGSPPGLPFGPAPATPDPRAQSESSAPPTPSAGYRLEVYGSAPAGDDVFRGHEPSPEPPPELPAQSGPSVILICDSWQAEDMIAARLRTLGADPERIITFTEVDCTDQCGGHRHPRPIRLPLDRPMFEYILRQHRGCRLIVIDDLECYCESPRQLRQAIRDLDETAIYFGVAIVATLQGNIRFAPDGTIRDTARTIDGLARCIWCITPDTAHPGLLRLEPKRMAFCKKPEGIAFRISDAGQIVWEPLPPYEKPPTEAARRKKLEHARMLTWLGATLGTEVVLAETVYDAGSEQGFSKKKLIAAREELAARTFKYGFGRVGAWMWTLKPQSEVTDAEIQSAYLHLPQDFPPDLKDALEKSVPGRDGVVEEAAEGSATRASQESENFGVLRKNGGKNAGSRSSRKDRKRSRSYDGMSLEQLRELGMRVLVGRMKDEG